jgi:hypothetical protein
VRRERTRSPKRWESEFRGSWQGKHATAQLGDVEPEKTQDQAAHNVASPLVPLHRAFSRLHDALGGMESVSTVGVETVSAIHVAPSIRDVEVALDMMQLHVQLVTPQIDVDDNAQPQQTTTLPAQVMAVATPAPMAPIVDDYFTTLKRPLIRGD